MAKGRMDLNEFVGKLLAEQDGDVLREGIRVLAQALMESEVAGLIGAERHERTSERAGYRNGYRMRTWDTRVGAIGLAIPKIRPGSYFPSLLEPRRRAERALLAVVQEPHVHGVSTRKVDDLLKALGLDGMSKSEVSRICTELDAEVEAFRSRPISGEHPISLDRRDLPQVIGAFIERYSTACIVERLDTGRLPRRVLMRSRKRERVPGYRPAHVAWLYGPLPASRFEGRIESLLAALVSSQPGVADRPVTRRILPTRRPAEAPAFVITCNSADAAGCRGD